MNPVLTRLPHPHPLGPHVTDQAVRQQAKLARMSAIHHRRHTLAAKTVAVERDLVLAWRQIRQQGAIGLRA